MKPAENKISDASFIGHYFKLLVIRLKQFRTVKHVVLVVIVLFCILARYVILSADKNLTKPQTITKKNQKVRVRMVKFIFNNPVSQPAKILKYKSENLGSAKVDDLYFFVNEAQ